MVGDINSDGRTDLIWNDTSNPNRTYIGVSNGDGTFTFLPHQDHPGQGWSNYKTLVGDVNGDGRTDLIWNQTQEFHQTHVGLSNGDGTFTFLTGQYHTARRWGRYKTLVGDVNGDGRTDLIWNDTYDFNRVYVGLSNDDGTFTFVPPQDHTVRGWRTYQTLVGDINGDGRTDLIWNDTHDLNRIYVGLSNGDGTFTFVSHQDHPERGWIDYTTLVGDVNGDGRADLIWNETTHRNRTYIGLSNDDGTFTFVSHQDRIEQGWRNYQALVGDVNGDGQTDLIWHETSGFNRTYVGLSKGALVAHNYPFSYTLSQNQDTSAGVYDQTGRLVQVLWEMRPEIAGVHTKAWNGRDSLGHPAPAGPYEVRIILSGYQGATYANANVGVFGNSAERPESQFVTPHSLWGVASDGLGNVITANLFSELSVDFMSWDANGMWRYAANFPENTLTYAVTAHGDYLYFAVHEVGSSNAQMIRRFNRVDGSPNNWPPSTPDVTPQGFALIYADPTSEPGWIDPRINPGIEAEIQARPLKRMAILDQRNELLVVDAVRSRILRIRLVDGQPAGHVDISGTLPMSMQPLLPVAIAVDRQTQNIWVGHHGGGVMVFDANGQSLGEPIQGLQDIRDMVIDPSGAYLYIADNGTGEIRAYRNIGNPQAQAPTLDYVVGHPAVVSARVDFNAGAFAGFHELRGITWATNSLITIDRSPAGGARLVKWQPADTSHQLAPLWMHYSTVAQSGANYHLDDPTGVVSLNLHEFNTGIHPPNGNAAEWYRNHAGDGIGYHRDPTGTMRLSTLNNTAFAWLPLGDSVQVYRKVGDAYRMVSILGGRNPHKDGSTILNQDANGMMERWHWVNADVMGGPEAAEIVTDVPPGLGNNSYYSTTGMSVDATGTIWWVPAGGTGTGYSRSIRSIPINRYNAAGNPIYDWNDDTAVISPDPSPITQFRPVFAQKAATMLFAHGLSAPALGHGHPLLNGNALAHMAGTTMAGYNASYERLWLVGPPPPPPHANSTSFVGLDVVPGGFGGFICGTLAAHVSGAPPHVNIAFRDQARLYHYSDDGLRIGVMQPGPAMAGASGLYDTNSAIGVNRNPNDGLVDVFTEDDENLRIGWYRFDDSQLSRLTIPLTKP